MFRVRNLIMPRLPAAITIFVITCAAVFYCTAEYGIGLTPDSATYLSVAKSLRTSGTLNDYTGSISSHFPPGYSAILAVSSIVTGRDVRHGAPRLVSAITWGLLVSGTLLLASSQGMSAPAVSACVLAIAFHPGLFEYSLYALSDLPVVTLICLSWLSLEAWHGTGRRRWLWVAGSFAAVGCLCRYAGVVWPLCAAAAVVASGPVRGLGVRMREAGSLLALSWCPLGLWLLASRLFLQSQSPRQLAFHPVTGTQVLAGLSEIAASVGFAGKLSGTIVLGIVAVCVLSRFRLGHIRLGCGLSTSFLARALFVPAYFIFLLISISLLDRATPLDARILLPASWCTAVMVCECLDIALRKRSLTSAILFWGLIGFFAIRGIVDTCPRIVNCKTQGLFLACADVLYDSNLAWVREDLSSSQTVYSNVSWTVYLACKRSVRQLPSRVDYTTGRPNLTFREQMDVAVAKVKEGLAVIVIDTACGDPNFLPPTASELVDAGLRVMNKSASERFLILGGH